MVEGAVMGALSAVDPVYAIGTVIVAQAIGRAIPDSKGGVLGLVRKLAKIVGLYVPNRI